MQQPAPTSGVETARQIRAGELSSRQAVDAAIARAEAWNPRLNAIVAERYDLARAEADAADARLAREGAEAVPPLHGVPCSIKECFALEGMPNAAGLVSRRELRSTADATAVGRYRAAGAIPLGVTNTSELCMWMESNNYLYGRTNNPYDSRCTVGGSSGGEGAVVGAGVVPFGLGSDVGGSIRMPAFFNGVFGHKPSGGLVPSTGQFPAAAPQGGRYLCTGPLCNHAEDLWPLLTLLAGPDGQDLQVEELRLGEPTAVDVGSLRVLDVPGNGAQRVSADLQATQRRVGDALQARGARVQRRRFPELRRSLDIWAAALGEASEQSFAELMGGGVAINPWWELAKWSVRASDFTAMASLLALTEKIERLMPGRTRRMLQLGRDLRARLDDLLGDDGVLLYPSYTRAAPRHNAPFHRQLMLGFDYAYTAVLNVMQVPVTQIPTGLDARGLPLGIQVGARRGNDHLCVAVALAIEEDLGGWVPPATAGTS